MGGTGDLGVAEFLRELAAPTPAPGAGGALSATAAMAAALVEMTAQISAQRGGGDLSDERLAEMAKRASSLGTEVVSLGDADAAAYGAVIEAMKRDRDDPGRRDAVASALSAAADPPLQLSELSAELTELAAAVVSGGRDSVRGDAIAGVLLAEAATAGAARLVAIDVDSPSDPRITDSEVYAARAAVARRLATT